MLPEVGALAWGDVAIAQACESLHHSVTQMSVFSQKYTQIKVKPPVPMLCSRGWV